MEAGDLRLVLEKAPQGLRVLSLVDAANNQELLAGDPLPLFSSDGAGHEDEGNANTDRRLRLATSGGVS